MEQRLAELEARGGIAWNGGSSGSDEELAVMAYQLMENERYNDKPFCMKRCSFVKEELACPACKERVCPPAFPPCG